MIVVDTNIIVYLCFGGDLAPLAEEVLTADSEWHAPLLWRSEFRNVMAGFSRQGTIAPEGARRLVGEAEVLLVGREHLVDSQSVLRLVERSSCSAYDCEYVALAKRLEVPLVTNDRQILRSFPEIARSMSDFLGRDADSL